MVAKRWYQEFKCSVLIFLVSQKHKLESGGCADCRTLIIQANKKNKKGKEIFITD